MSHPIRAARRLILVISVALAAIAVVAPTASAAGELVAEPEEVAFGAVTAGEQRSLQVLFRNLGPDSVILGDAWLLYDEGATVEPFAVDVGSCAAVVGLAAGDSCEMTATFTAPQSVGMFDALIVIEGGGIDPGVALLSGHSVTPPPPPPPPAAGTLVADPPQIGFPKTRINAVSAPRQVRVRNTGGAPVALPVATVTTPHFAVVSNACPPVLQVGAECVVAVVFKPTYGSPLPVGWGVGQTRQRGSLVFGEWKPGKKRGDLAVVLSGDTMPPLDLATIKRTLETVSRSVPKVLRGGPREAFLTAFQAPEAGSLALRVYGWVGKRRVLVAKGRDPFIAGERHELPVTVTRRGRRMLRQPKRTRIKVVLSFTTTDRIATKQEQAFKVKPPKVKRPAKRKGG